MRLPISGDCLCGAIPYAISEPPLTSDRCHCSNCRKHTGAAFATDATFNSAVVTWAGRDQSYFRSPPSCERGFCPVCGSTVSARYSSISGIVIVAAGSLDDINVLAPSNHAFMKDKAIWIGIDNGLPRFPGPLPDFEAESKG